MNLKVLQERHFNIKVGNIGGQKSRIFFSLVWVYNLKYIYVHVNAITITEPLRYSKAFLYKSDKTKYLSPRILNSSTRQAFELHFYTLILYNFLINNSLLWAPSSRWLSPRTSPASPRSKGRRGHSCKRRIDPFQTIAASDCTQCLKKDLRLIEINCFFFMV